MLHCSRWMLALSVSILSSHNHLPALAEVGHVIHISVDGLRGDILLERVANQPELYPNLKRFVEEGATTFNARTDYTHTTALLISMAILPSTAPTLLYGKNR